MKKWVKGIKNGEYLNTDKFIKIFILDYKNQAIVRGYTENQYYGDEHLDWETCDFFIGTQEECEKYLEDLMNG